MYIEGFVRVPTSLGDCQDRGLTTISEERTCEVRR